MKATVEMLHMTKFENMKLKEQILSYKEKENKLKDYCKKEINKISSNPKLEASNVLKEVLRILNEESNGEKI